jgi:hypothetical protein
MNDDAQFASSNIAKKRAKFRRIKENALTTMTIIQFNRFNARLK